MDPNAPIKQPRSPLFYVAIGCGGLMALIVVGFLIAGLLLPVMTLSIPMMMDMALLGDKEPLADGGGVHWRNPTSGSTSIRWAAVSWARRAPHEGHHPRDLQENAITVDSVNGHRDPRESGSASS